MTIDVFYIATGVYSDYFKVFFETISAFMPSAYKRIHVISDRLGEYKGLMLHDKSVEVIPILDLPYPVIPLLKTFLIKTYMKDDMRYVFYFDADTAFVEKDEAFWNTMLQALDGGECIMSVHPGGLTKPNYDIWEGSKAHLDKEETFYAISSFFAANHDTMLRLCDCINALEKDDLQMNDSGHPEHYIPPLFDQDYFNKMITDRNDVSFYLKRFVNISWLDTSTSDDWFICQKYDISKKFAKKNMI